MNVSIIIVNYNTKELTLQTIASVFEKTADINFEVIVVDNASTDGSTEAIEKTFPEVKLIKSNENLGFGRANNLGATIASGRNLLFLNPDTLLVNNAVKILSDYLDLHESVGVCGGNLYDAEMKPASSYHLSFSPLLFDINSILSKKLFPLIYGKNYTFNHTGKHKKVAHIVGANMMIRKSIFDQVGGFDKEYFMYREETELNYRVYKKGYNTMSIPEAKIIHLESKSFSCNYNRTKCILESRKIHYRKVGNQFSYLIGNIIYAIFSILRMCIFKIKRNNEKVRYWKFILKNL